MKKLSIIKTVQQKDLSALNDFIQEHHASGGKYVLIMSNESKNILGGNVSCIPGKGYDEYNYSLLGYPNMKIAIAGWLEKGEILIYEV